MREPNVLRVLWCDESLGDPVDTVRFRMKAVVSQLIIHIVENKQEAGDAQRKTTQLDQ